MRLLTSWLAAVAREAAWAPALVFGFHLLAVNAFQWYADWADVDIPMHFAGGLAIGFFFHRAARSAAQFGLLGSYHAVTHAILVFALVATTTVFWEFAELLSDRYLGTRTQHGLDDTLGDMFFGMLGGLVVVAVIFATSGSAARSPARGRTP